MNVYIYQSDVYCEKCGKVIREKLTAEGNAPAHPDDEYTYDSDYFPKGPYPDGGGESDCPQHCGRCQVFLNAPLTSEGVNYVLKRLKEYVRSDFGSGEVLDEWAADLKDYSLDDDEQFVLDAYNAVRTHEKRDTAKTPKT